MENDFENNTCSRSMYHWVATLQIYSIYAASVSKFLTVFQFKFTLQNGKKLRNGFLCIIS